jgi:hypothetical protein
MKVEGTHMSIVALILISFCVGIAFSSSLTPILRDRDFTMLRSIASPNAARVPNHRVFNGVLGLVLIVSALEIWGLSINGLMPLAMIMMFMGLLCVMAAMGRSSESSKVR